MKRLYCEKMLVGPIETNCYFPYNKETGECLIIDPGFEADRIQKKIEQEKWKPQGILLTHGHFDHMYEADVLRKKLGVKIYAPHGEEKMMADGNMNLSSMMGMPAVSLKADEWFEDGQKIEFLGQQMQCILTPGHTGGGMCFYFPDAGILFSGDTLFQESVGRTDFPTGSMSVLIRSLREKILVLPDAVQVYPGHGDKTSIQNEKMYNPYSGM